MKTYEAVGVIETLYFTVAIEMLDEMLKSSNVEFLRKETTLGGKLITLFVGGSVSEVSNAIELVKKLGEGKHINHLKNAIVISKPHPEILKYVISSEKIINEETLKVNN